MVSCQLGLDPLPVQFELPAGPPVVPAPLAVLPPQQLVVAQPVAGLERRGLRERFAHIVTAISCFMSLPIVLCTNQAKLFDVSDARP